MASEGALKAAKEIGEFCREYAESGGKIAHVNNFGRAVFSEIIDRCMAAPSPSVPSEPAQPIGLRKGQQYCPCSDPKCGEVHPPANEPERSGTCPTCGSYSRKQILCSVRHSKSPYNLPHIMQLPECRPCVHPWHVIKKCPTCKSDDPSSAEGVGTGEPEEKCPNCEGKMALAIDAPIDEGVMLRCTKCGHLSARWPEGERMSARETPEEFRRSEGYAICEFLYANGEPAMDRIYEFATAYASSLRGTEERELEQLRAWKESAIEVWPDMQKIGKLIGVQLGDSVHDKIIPWIEAAESREAKLRECLRVAIEWEADYRTRNNLGTRVPDWAQWGVKL